MKASTGPRVQAEEVERERKYNCEKKSYLYTVEYNTNLSLQVVHSCGLSTLSVVLHEDFVHRALQVFVYLDKHKEENQCWKRCTLLYFTADLKWRLTSEYSSLSAANIA